MAELKPVEYIMRLDYGAQNGPEVIIHAKAVQRLVRCKDCRYSEIQNGVLCCDTLGAWNISEDGFCSFGERRDDDGEG